MFFQTGAVGGGVDYEEEIVDLQGGGKRDNQQQRATSGLPRIQVIHSPTLAQDTGDLFPYTSPGYR